MSIIKCESHRYNKYCEPYGGTPSLGIDLIKSGYKGQVLYNTDCKAYNDFWRIIQENPDKLVKEINFLIQALSKTTCIQDEMQVLNKKLEERKAIQRAAAHYISIFGVNKKHIRENIDELRESTKAINWFSLDPRQFMLEQDSPTTMFFLRPGTRYDVLSDEAVDFLSGLNGAWVIEYFYNKKALSQYKNFNITYDYSDNSIHQLSITISNI